MSSGATTTGREFATVRIAKVVLDDFKSVQHGEIVLKCGREFVPAGTESDILGLYGQNGTGKTTLIEALSILHHLLAGAKVPDEYAECVAVGADHARLSFEFDFQYPNGRVLRVGYAASIRAVEKVQENGGHFAIVDGPTARRVTIFDEVVSMGGMLDGEERPYGPCIDTTSDAGRPFGPASLHACFFDGSSATKDQLFIKRILASERSQSFIFMNDVLALDGSNSIFGRPDASRSDYLVALWELKLFGSRYLFVIDSASPALASADIAMPLFTRYGTIPLRARGSQEMRVQLVKHLKVQLASINEVLGELVPGLSVTVRELKPCVLEDGSEGVVVAVMSNRSGTEFPLRYESDGVKKIISSLGLLTTAFNEKSVTVAIDEFDAGVFEYLLGELLQLMQDYGRGQLIFTSHNLRPLEVLSEDFIWFTTANPQNRYFRMEVDDESNLRDGYFREIMVGEQDEVLYDSSKRFKIIGALKRAGANHAV